MKFSHRSAGFTLIELMIVCVIIGILAAVAVPNIFAMQRLAKEGATKTNMHLLQLAVEDFSDSHNGAYPTSIEEVKPLIVDASGPKVLINAFTRRPIDYSKPAPGNICLISNNAGYRIIGWGGRGRLDLELVSAATSTPNNLEGASAPFH